MKLLVLAPQSIHTRKWVEPFAKDRDFEILVVSFDTGNEDVLKGIPTKFIKNRFGKFGYSSHFRNFKSICDEFKPDIIHAHFVTSYGYMAAKLNFHPLVISAWGSDITLGEKNLLRKHIIRKVLNSADYVNFAGDYLKKVALKMGFNASVRNEVFQYGVDLEEISRYRMNFEVKNPNIIVSPRGFSEVYNFKNQILAMNIVNKLKPNLKLLMYGSGDLSKAKTLVDSLKIGSCVEIIGKVDQKALWNSMGNAFAVVSVPYRDGTPLSLLESMAIGAFPIVSDIPPNREWIEDKKTGLFVNPNSPEEIAQAIITASENVQMIETAFKMNFEVISSKADYKKNMQKMKDIYKSIVK